MVRQWWSSDGDIGDMDCCYGGSCYYKYFFLKYFIEDVSMCGVGSGGGITIGFGGSFLDHHHHQ